MSNLPIGHKIFSHSNFLVLFIVLSSVFSFTITHAQTYTASLYFSPSTGSYTVGNNFSVDVKVNTGGAAINAAEGTVVFNPNDLEVANVSKNNSVFALWT